MNLIAPPPDDRRMPHAGGDRPGRCLPLDLLFRQYASRVYNLALRMLANATDAEDVTQDVFLQVVRKLDSFRGEAELTTWLHRVTVNAVLLHRRRLARRPERPMAPTREGVFARPENATPGRSLPANPVQQTLRHESRQLIDGAVARLPRRYRDVYLLADVDGCSNAEIGGRLKLSLPAVKSRLHRARAMLRSALAAYFAEGCAVRPTAS
jgi:RNA polymerase sigma-70 factor (ECF subfamily)